MSFFCDNKNCPCQISFDYDFTEYLFKNALHIMDHYYFRAKIINFDKLPPKKDREVRIFFSNHSGMAFPWDAIVFNSLYWEMTGYDKKRFIRPLVAPQLSETLIMCPFMIKDLWRRAGGIDATLDNFETMMTHGWDILIYPEGIPGIGKGFDRKYQIQRFSTSFIRMALKYKAKLIPIYTINAEYVHPYSYKNDTLNRLVNMIGIPFLPLSPLTPGVAVFPWMFYFSLPANMRFVIGEPIDPEELLRGRDYDSLKRKDFIEIRDAIQQDFQSNINKYVEEYGEDPYNFKEFIEKLRENENLALYILPFGWPIMMHALVKNYESGNPVPLKYTPEEFYDLAIRNLDGTSFSIPFGWPLVLFFKGLIPEIIDKIAQKIEEILEKGKVL